MWPLSGSMNESRSTVGSVAWTVRSKPCFRQLGEQPAVVDVGVGEQHEVEVARLERECAVVELTYRLGALEHAAVNQEPPLSVLDLIARAGHSPGAAVKGQSYRHPLSSRSSP